MADAPLTVTVLPPTTRFNIRADPTAETLIGLAAGVTLPRAVCRAVTVSGRSALWLGPDEWLLIGPAAEGAELAARIAGALGDEPSSVVDVSDRSIGIAVGGPKAADAINGFNPLDLRRAAFPVGMCTRTVFGKTEIVLWRTAADTFRIEVARSFAPYVLGCLALAGREHAGAPTDGEAEGARHGHR